MDYKATVRQATDEDEAFLRTLHREAMGPHVEAAWGSWDAAVQSERFAKTPVSQHQIVVVDDTPIGCLLVLEGPDAVFLSRIWLMPSAQGRGLGTQLIRQLYEKAEANRRPVRLRVLKVNPARRLYERLGFEIVEDGQIHFVMERAAHELITPTTDREWESFHRIRREVLFEARGQYGVYNANHPDDRAAGNHPRVLVHRGDHIGVVRIDVDGPVAALRRVAIRADVQRRGHGRALLNLVERFARDAGCTRLVSFVAPDAVGFYQAFGFVIEQERASWPAGHASVYMTRVLD